MNKRLIALAALATVGSAMAQSNVTLYGRLNTSYGHEKTTSPTWAVPRCTAAT